MATYGQMAALAGRPRAARAVGGALAALSGDLVATVPWQRVVNGAGRCSHPEGELQREMLEGEGVRFGRDGRIDLAAAGGGDRGRRR